MELEQTLKLYGLNKKEAVVYLAALQLGKETAFRIAKQTELKRPTVYVTLNELNVKGLMHISKSSKATLYQAVSPQRLLEQIERRKRKFAESLPLLMTLYKSHPDKPKIEVREGKSGLEQVYEEVINFSAKGNEILTFGKLDHFRGDLKIILDRWLLESKRRKTKVREIINEGEAEQKYLARVKDTKNLNHHIKIAGKMTFLNDNIIYGDKLAIISTVKDLFVTLIESKGIAQTYRNFFDLAWTNTR